MKSSTIRQRLALSILICTASLLSACAFGTPTAPSLLAFNCANRVPPQLRDAVPGADLPDGTEGSYAVALDTQTGKLDQANDEKQTVIWIYDTCEAEREQVRKELRPKGFLARIFSR